MPDARTYRGAGAPVGSGCAAKESRGARTFPELSQTRFKTPTAFCPILTDKEIELK